MKILLIHQAFASPCEPGGTRHFELGRHMVASGHSFTVVASNISYVTGRRTEGAAGAQVIEGVRVLRTNVLAALHRNFVWRVLSFLSFMVNSAFTAMRAGQVDLVMGTSPPIFQAVSACLVAKLRRKPFLLEIRDLWPEFAVAMGVLTNPLLIGPSRWLEKRLYKSATHILVNSPAYRDYLEANGVPASKISLICNGVDVGMFDAQATGRRLRKQWNLDGKFIITYAGAMGMANDLSTLLRAAALLQAAGDVHHLHFVLVGDGKERVRLEMLAQELALENVLFAGSYPKSDMGEVLAASDACLAILQDIPMFRTTYPNKVFDYMAAGRPTILAIGGVIKDVIEAAHGGIAVEPGRPEALVQAVRELATDAARARAMGVSARTYVEQHFNRERQAAQFVELCGRLVN